MLQVPKPEKSIYFYRSLIDKHMWRWLFSYDRTIYHTKFPVLDRTTDNKNLEDVLRRSSVNQVIKSSVNWCLFDVKDVWFRQKQLDDSEYSSALQSLSLFSLMSF